MAVGVSERGSLHSGLQEWVVQRLSAVYMLFYIVAIFILFLTSPIHSHAEWLVLSSGLLFQITLLLFIFSMLIHVWLGLKSVLLDYVHAWGLRFSLLTGIAVSLIAAGVWAVLVVTIK